MERGRSRHCVPAEHLPTNGERGVPCGIYVAPAPEGLKVMVQENHGHCAAISGPASSHVHSPQRPAAQVGHLSPGSKGLGHSHYPFFKH